MKRIEQDELLAVAGGADWNGNGIDDLEEPVEYDAGYVAPFSGTSGFTVELFALGGGSPFWLYTSNFLL